MYIPACLAPFPADLADSLLEQALSQFGLAKDRLSDLTDAEKQRLDTASPFSFASTSSPTCL